MVLRDDAVFSVNGDLDLWVTGTLVDQTKITLIDCVRTAQSTHTRAEEGVKSHSVTLFPHFIAQGSLHLVRDEPTIRTSPSSLRKRWQRCEATLYECA